MTGRTKVKTFGEQAQKTTSKTPQQTEIKLSPIVKKQISRQSGNGHIHKVAKKIHIITEKYNK